MSRRDESPFQPDQLREEEREVFYHGDIYREDDWEAPFVLPPNAKPTDFVSLIERTVENGVEVLIYQRRKE